MKLDIYEVDAFASRPFTGNPAAVIPLDSWLEDSPLEVARSKDLSSAGMLYLSCGKKDDWGCMAGSKQLVSVAKSSGATVHWHPMEGGHCDIDRTSLAQFLGHTAD